ncbi:MULTISPECIES: hypothetical protein [Alteromonas]|jgi:hypothetical protein|uniref:hypothetical protein n=1 Tax=Alteromonas TaxID=226 RepID=UPI00066C3DF5|nr:MULTISPECIES: hypothetical protein [Alteromonas]MCP3702036.1 hypothetical protein [Alteromonas sp.]MEC7083227.1 hypothetical protein [Pseudomonadota bacterium]MCG7641723.1 hypothetical protein [Alteromonas sp. MmMcT2-2]MCG7649045.1 hypothetical protein [Alteromonas sp. MmMcT2-5]MEC7451342.1 hypothetical protein [Pseudomonadota bacterium]|tara:strand:+ start:232 stop:981 length:750 start_codon:yes stop_codon:yes gene_type:complete
MSNKKIPSTESVSTVDQDSSVLNGTATSPLKSSPLFGWLYAGSDLLSAKLDHAAGVVSQKIDDTQETINSMQAKGLEVESELRRTLNPFALVDAAQKLVASTPLFSAFSGGQKRQQKEQQLELLSAKVDLLVEQVALLAAKEAAKKAEAKSAASKTAAPKNTSPKSTQATRSTSTKSSSTASSTSRARKASTTKSASASSSTTKKASAGTTNKRTAAKSTTTKSAAQKKAASAEATSTKSATDTTKNDE